MQVSASGTYEFTTCVYDEGALGPIRNRKTVEKNHPKPKTACKTVNTDTCSHPSY